MKADEDDFRAFVEQQWVPLVRTAYLLTGDRGLAEDLVQTALEKTHRRWGMVAALDSPWAYVHRTMVNTAVSWRRRRSSGEVPQIPADAPGPDDPYERADQRHQLLTALRRLPPKMRAVLVLRYFEDRSEADIAAIMGCSPGTVKSQASRGLDRLRQQLTPIDLPLAVVLQESCS